MVVMETVRAATLASSKKKSRLATERAVPLAASSPKDTRSDRRTLPIDVCPPSPLSVNSPNIPEELVRYKNQTYVAPEKLQIVKPLEGSVTLLKWRLMASPQLGGATSFFSDASRPGVHMKKWKAVEEGSSRLAGTKVKSRSTTDISRLQQDSHSSSVKDWANHSHLGIQNPTSVTSPTPEHRETRTVNKSLLNQVGTLLGTGWSRLGFGRDTTTGDNDDSNNTSALEDVQQ